MFQENDKIYTNNRGSYSIFKCDNNINVNNSILIINDNSEKEEQIEPEKEKKQKKNQKSQKKKKNQKKKKKKKKKTKIKKVNVYLGASLKTIKIMGYIRISIPIININIKHIYQGKT